MCEVLQTSESRALIPDMQPLVSSAEAAERIGISRSSLILLVRIGDASAAQKLPGKTGAYLFTEAEVERLRAKMVEA